MTLAFSSIEMRHLRLVGAIATHGSLTGAARILQLTQPALSHQLRELETRLRTPLFLRTTRRMVPTPAGEQLAQLAATVLAQVEGFERQVLEGEFSEARGAIRLATECYTCYHWLPNILKAFNARWPGVDLRIAPEHTASPANALREGALDIAILHRFVPDRRLRLEPLFDDELVVCVSPQHELARRPFVRAQDFANQHLIAYNTADGRLSILSDVLEPAGVSPQRITRIQLTEAIIELVSADLGIAVLARWAVAPHARAGRIQTVRLTENGFTRKWYAAMRADDPSPAYQFDLVEMLRRQLSGGPMLHETLIA
jgi:LysR family transcriptional regulator, regulator for metE and metH